MAKQSSNFFGNKNIFCIGIGGIGLSALAQMFKKRVGAHVSGSNINESHVTSFLESDPIDIPVFIGQEIEMFPKDTEVVVYSQAIADHVPLFLEDAKKEIPGAVFMTYPEALGKFTESEKTICVCGTHGKTTTTAMLAEVLAKTSHDPHVIVGSLMKAFSSNYHEGKSDLLLVEACEYKRSFLNYHPQTIIITNIDADHLDTYGNIDNIYDAFVEFIHKLYERDEKDGLLIFDATNDHTRNMLSRYKEIYGHDITGQDSGVSCIDYSAYVSTSDSSNALSFEKFNVPVTGVYNQKNAAAAYACAQYLGIPESNIRESLRKFEGTWRRFEYKGALNNYKEMPVYTDYAHHPTELDAFLDAFVEMFPVQENKRACIVFEPHLHSRTAEHFDAFVNAFMRDDLEIIITPIYAARPSKDELITSQKIVDEILKKNSERKDAEKNSNLKIVFKKDFDDVKKYIQENAHLYLAIATVGAGNMHLLAEQLIASPKTIASKPE